MGKMGVLAKYKYSILLYLAIAICVLLNNPTNLLKDSLKIINSIDLEFFILMPIAMFLSTFSFALPFKLFARLNQRNLSWSKAFELCIRWTYLNIAGKDGNSYFLSTLWIPKEKKEHVFGRFRSIDYLAIIFIVLAMLPFVFFTNPFYWIAAGFSIVAAFCLLYMDKRYLPRQKIYLHLAVSIMKYPIESIVPLVLLLSFGYDITIPILLFFTTTTCILYYIPRFKLAGGLLTLYLVCYSLFLGKGILLGFITATILRISSLVFFVLPLSVIGGMRKWG